MDKPHLEKIGQELEKLITKEEEVSESDNLTHTSHVVSPFKVPESVKYQPGHR